MKAFFDRLRAGIPVTVKRMARLARRFLKALAGSDHWIRKDISLPARRYGNDWADWIVARNFLTADSVIYSFGLGRDVSFEQGLIADIGCLVKGFDPTPISMAYVRSLGEIRNFHAYPYALSTFDGTKHFGLPGENEVSFSTQHLQRGSVELPVRSLASLMAELGDVRIDLLKLDIEGEEYGVIDDMLAQGILPGQLLVEFHHAWGIADLAATRKSLAMLRGAGYRIFDISAAGREISLIHSSRLR